MTEERNSAGMDPTELWSQWYETSSKMWSNVMGGNMNGGQEGAMDPHGLYRQWLAGMEQMRDRMMSVPGMMPQAGMMPWMGTGSMGGAGSTASQNLWNKWLEASAEGWQKSAQLGTEMMEMAPRWTQAMEQARDNLMAAQSPARDPLELTVQWYNATSGPVSEFVQEMVEREDFLEPSSRFLQSYASLYKIFKRNSEEYLSTLQLPVRSDITRVASLIVAVEDKVDRIEEAFEDFEYGYAEPATAESVGTLEKSVGALDRRIDRVEGKLDQLLTAIEGLSSNGNAGTNGSEAPAAAAETAREAPQEEIKATDAAQRKAQELGVALSEIEGSGADGQITVGDVREKGTS